MQRYFVDPPQMGENDLTITGDDVHHIKNVMRYGEGDEIIVSNGRGRDVTARIRHVSGEVVHCDIIGELDDNRELPVQITIAQSLPKADKMELIIQKGTELGAFQFLPVISERTIVRLDGKKAAKKIDRWSRIAKEAAEQSHRSRIPQITVIHTWRELLDQADAFDTRLLAYEQEQGATLYEALQPLDEGSSILLLIGPEGGFSEKEVDEALSAGFRSISLGRRILRTETASLYGLSCISYHYEQVRK
ncbi:MAG: 16S rRNA (uracil(1498)-N(3))-methyltransferase [Bacillaceae bacterium]|nr:16S rRNA (uracil(1498)-N(3))-methyltransferase [Bacillaceae bacterium]